MKHTVRELRRAKKQNDFFITLFIVNISVNDFLFLIVGAELAGRATLLFAKKTVEIGEVVETAVEAYFRHSHGGINEQAGCRADTDVDNIVGE